MTEKKLAKGLRYADLPVGLSEKERERQVKERLFTYISKPLIDGLAELFKGKNVLEAYAGRGHISALLHEQGINIKATSLRQGHDASDMLGHVFDVEDMDVVTAIHTYKDWMDFLIVCWPTTDMGLYNSLKLIPITVPIVFIGEVTDYSVSPPFLGGCASDDFFNNVVEDKKLTAQIDCPAYGCSQIKVFNRKPTIEKRLELDFDDFFSFR